MSGQPTHGDATAVLHTLFAVEPLYWTSFYERARFFRGRPAPHPPEVVFDLTKDCPLDCDFCFAADTLHSGIRIDPPQLADLAHSLRGLPRVLLLGGEPLTHPAIDACLDLLDEPGRRICIYTNGLPLPEDPGRRAGWLDRRFARLHARVELTLSVDRFHRDQLGEAAFSARIDALLGLVERPDAPVDVRFNVTADSLSTGGYLVADRVVATLDGLHPGLRPLFERAMRSGRVDAHFQFNPVIQMGRAAASEGELLNAGDTLLKPQVVVGPRPGGGIGLVSSLPATWMRRVPDPLAVAEVGQGGLAAAITSGLVSEQVGAALVPETMAAFEALHALRLGLPEAPDRVAAALRAAGERTGAAAAALCRALQRAQPSELATVLRVHAARVMVEDWPRWHGPWHARLAGRLAELCASGDQAWDLGGDRPHRRLIVATLRRFLALHLGAGADRGAHFVNRCAALATEALQACGYPAFCGYREREGLITDRPESPLPLTEVALDQGVASPYFGDALVSPRVVARMSVDALGQVDLSLDGVGVVAWAAQTSVEEARSGQAALLGMLEFLLPAPLHAAFRGALAARAAALLAGRGPREEPDIPGQQRPEGWRVLVAELATLPCLPVAEVVLDDRRALARLLLGDAAPALLAAWRSDGAD